MPTRRLAQKISGRASAIATVLSGLAGIASPARASEIDTLLFGSLDAGGDTFLTVGAKAGLTSLAQEGFAAVASAGGGGRAERGADGPRVRYTVAAAALAGYQWFFDWGVVAAYAGPEIAREVLIAGPQRDALPTRFGVRLHGEVWARPTEATLLQASAVAGSTRDSLWARLAWGYRFWETYLGPEAALYTDGTGYAKWSFGLHGTDFALGRYSFRASAGLQSESGRGRACPYVTLSVWSPL
ncbi:cellulose biosynthesis protein BcsS [Methylobacterium sp. NMS14P]|uniref:cellulose biosynthesis protein BcsS n=1 Tax=Methylobacterium sp. NMS14P TaxID=2894310 RepID=UPI002358747B|nr:cellulose biosynthesis protein BcsS [Methylobacterium sp. NMS14P]WCS25191.1 cellulose biosynthesis protein BcsS [Methylobacterium sp. NMS14P]